MTSFIKTILIADHGMTEQKAKKLMMMQSKTMGDGIDSSYKVLCQTAAEMVEKEHERMSKIIGRFEDMVS